MELGAKTDGAKLYVLTRTFNGMHECLPNLHNKYKDTITLCPKVCRHLRITNICYFLNISFPSSAVIITSTLL